MKPIRQNNLKRNSKVKSSNTLNPIIINLQAILNKSNHTVDTAYLNLSRITVLFALISFARNLTLGQ